MNPVKMDETFCDKADLKCDSGSKYLKDSRIRIRLPEG